MGRLKPEKLHVTYLAGTAPDNLQLPRRYTLTHSDTTGELFLSIGSYYDTRKTSRFYTRLMRDEVLAELTDEGDGPTFRIYCHVSGGFVFGRAKWRYDIFQSQLPLALEAIRYGDGILFEQNPELDQIPVLVYFQSTNSRFNKVERWGVMSDYKTPIDKSHT
jgi:hypothetical protein